MERLTWVSAVASLTHTTHLRRALDSPRKSNPRLWHAKDSLVDNHVLIIPEGDRMQIAQWIGVSKRYPKAERLALQDVSFGLSPGEIVVMVGPNGSGKTTAMEMLSGLRTPTTGEVRFQGDVVRRGGWQRLALGVQLQEAGLPLRIRVREAIDAVACLYRDPGPVDEIVASLGLRDQLGAMVDSLSGGWQRRLDVALACIGRPDVLVLDEPTSGLDPVARAELWEFLRERRAQGNAILASTHDLGEAEAFADRLIVLHRGRLILEGPVDQVLAKAGGEWRVRVIGGDEAVRRLGEAAGLPFLSAGEGMSALGPRSAILDLANRIEEARERGEATYRDLLRGPVRLEDVFAYAIGRG